MTTIISHQVTSDIEKTPSIETRVSTELQKASASNPRNPHGEPKWNPAGHASPCLSIQLTKRLQLVDPEERILYNSGDTPCRSFVAAFLKALHSCFINEPIRATDTNGFPNLLAEWGITQTILLNTRAWEGEEKFGPVVGTGIAPLGNYDHKLDAQIMHGTDPGQLLYSATSIVAPTVLAGAMTLTLIRTFTNRTAADITVTECGIYTRGRRTDVPAYHCIIRDLVDPKLTVPPDHAILLEYKILTRV